MPPPHSAEQDPAAAPHQDMPDRAGGCKALCQFLSNSHSNLQPEAPARQTWIKKFCDCRATGPPWPCTRVLSLQDTRPVGHYAVKLGHGRRWCWSLEDTEPWVQLWALLPPCCRSSLDLPARTHLTSLKGSGLLHPPFQKSWPLSTLLLLPAAHYHQSQPQSWPPH